MVVGCGEVENGAYKHRPKSADKNESTPTTNTNKVDGTTEKPVKELTLEEKVVGEYEFNTGEDGGDTVKEVFLENGVREWHLNGKKREEDKWSIVDGEIQVDDGSSTITVARINKDGSITWIANIEDGKRTDFPKEDQLTWKRIK